MSENKVKQEVRRFYDQVGWVQVSDGIYQNARYEDLRPVSSEYITRCHHRVMRHIKPTGEYLLDAGSGPIQYPAYLEYSEGYHKRVCLDISITALQEARQRIGDKGLFVVADIARLPFKSDVFDSVVSLHTIHHLPFEDHIRAYHEMHRVAKPGCPAVLVNGWDHPLLVKLLDGPRLFYRRLQTGRKNKQQKIERKLEEGKGTFVSKYNAGWLKSELSKDMDVDIFVWRSVNVHFLRFFIRPKLGGRFLLKVLYALEELFPRFFGKYGAYPLVVIKDKAEK
jgi:ubiquinone/menaquinone biosynthesis C-methylase UbiE